MKKGDGIHAIVLSLYMALQHRSIALRTCGTVFLGTSFGGSGASSWGMMIANSAAIMGFSSETRLLKTLKEGSERLELLVSEFTVMAKLVDMTLVCFYQVHETKLSSFGIGMTTLVSWRLGYGVDTSSYKLWNRSLTSAMLQWMGIA